MRSFSSTELQAIVSDMRAALARGRMTPWQTNFLHDMLARFERYGVKTRLSDRQWEVLDQIIGRASAAAPAPSKPKVIRLPVSSWAPRYRRGRRRYWFNRSAYRDFAIGAAVLVVLAAISLVDQGEELLSLSTTTSVEGPSRTLSGPIDIIDGDTIRVSGEPRSVRLVGFNTPETGEPKCEAERALGVRAATRLSELVSKGATAVRLVPCACRPGTEGTDRCNFGRACGVLTVNGENVGDTLMAEGLAVQFQCSRTACPRLPRPWCS